MSDDKPSIDQLIEYYTGDPVADSSGRWGKTSCLFHDDNNPSASYHSEFNAFTCHSCLWSGDSWNLIEEKEGLDFGGAQQWAEENLGWSRSESTPASHGSQRPRRVSILDRGARSDRRDAHEVHGRAGARRRPRLR